MIVSGNSENLVALPIERINRQRRLEALQETDWTQTLDAPLSDDKKQIYVDYRKALRDLPTHENWPDLNDEDWPKIEV